MRKSKGDIKILIIGGSAGSYGVVRRIMSSLPSTFSIPVVLCLHRLKNIRNGFAESLNIDSKITITEPHDKERIYPGKVYLSPSNYHLLIEPEYSFALSTEPDNNYSRPSIDYTFESGGFSFKNNMAGILLSGTNTDGARGLFSAFKNGAFTIIQDPENAQFSTMPKEVLRYFNPDEIMTDEMIINFINSLTDNTYV
ncbi:MAG TPA: chemotaxis protein CheB [Bacteroidales bacterium]|nr:chemotaxis protein CheB [Bacteroidales bacterium]